MTPRSTATGIGVPRRASSANEQKGEAGLEHRHPDDRAAHAAEHVRLEDGPDPEEDQPERDLAQELERPHRLVGHEVEAGGPDEHADDEVRRHLREPGAMAQLPRGQGGGEDQPDGEDLVHGATA